MEEAGVYDEGYQGGSIRDIEERQRNLKDRLILVGQNLIEFREKTEDDILGIKKDVEILKNSMEKIRAFIETLSGEFGKMARKDDLDILVKQAKMFQPMNLATKEEIAAIKKEVIALGAEIVSAKKHKHNHKHSSSKK